MEVVINKCHGGFSLSHKAIRRYLELQGKQAYFYKQTKFGFINDGIDEYQKISEEENIFTYAILQDLGNISAELPKDSSLWFLESDIPRNDPLLIRVINELGQEVNTDCSKLEIITIPDNVEWEIEEYDGLEFVAEKHRTWG